MNICHTCLRRLTLNQAFSSRLARSTIRRFTGTGQSAEPVSTAAVGKEQGEAPVVSSSTSATSNATSAPKDDETAKSCIPAGTALRGMAFMKNKQPPVALEDDEYPEWLWGLLKTQKGGEDGATDAEGDIYCK